MSPNTSYRQVHPSLPFECVESSWDLAVTTWEQLKAARRGFPVVIGNEESIEELVAFFHDDSRTVEEILAVAATLQHPESLHAELVRQNRAAKSGAEYIRKTSMTAPPGWRRWVTTWAAKRAVSGVLQTIPPIPDEPELPPIGQWPDEPFPEDESVPHLSGAFHHKHSGGAPEKVYIALVPTEDWTTVPAHFRWGAFQACPAPEFHVAALRSWRDRFGAVLVAISSGRLAALDLRVSRAPQSREEALNLAREHYLYCAETAGEGIWTLSNLAANLLGKPWWHFVWDL